MILATILLLSLTPQLADASMEGMSQNKKPVPGYAEVQIDPGKLQLFGITTEKLQIRDLSKTIRTVGLVEVDERRIANVQTKFP